MNIPDIRIGQGIDVHAFAPGDFVTLGGIRIPHTHGLKAHSDGDVVLHALSDALLGALCLGDIGRHFPDTDASYAGADSGVLLQRIYQLIIDRQYRLVNTDITIACERPKISPHASAMQRRIAQLLDCEVDRISVKATTTEKLGFTGRQEGILVSCVVLLGRL